MQKRCLELRASRRVEMRNKGPKGVMRDTLEHHQGIISWDPKEGKGDGGKE